MKSVKLLLVLVCIAHAGMSGARNLMAYECVDFSVTRKGTHFFILENKTTEAYSTFTWDLGDGRVKKVSGYDEVYFPFKGEYVITLLAESQDLKCKRTRKVVVENDDPDYYKNFRLVWSDEFDGNTVNLDYWSFETGATGWGNNELQNYTNGENAVVKDGHLIITARKVGHQIRQKRGDYTSTRMITKGKKEFQYGRIEVRAKMPKGTGTWAAFWMLGAGHPEIMWPHCGEIDIMEYVGYDPNIHNVAIHNGSSFGNTRNKSKIAVEDAVDDFHVYGLIWDKYSLKFYVDDVENVFYTYKPENYDRDTWPHSSPYFIILNLAVGGGWGGKKGVDDTVFPADYIVDYVRVYQNPEY
ncbi:family 16 glycosylhydrolase [Bacteroides sp.]|uniref:glycoside hydrolase family 16 protein n=1 Tax=Bacteroides sp. TaxID=29523 RepID=UPI003A92C72D